MLMERVFPSHREIHGLSAMEDRPAGPTHGRRLELDNAQIAARRVASDSAQLSCIEATIKYNDVACVTEPLLNELKKFQFHVNQIVEDEKIDHFLIWKSGISNIFSLGGDISFFLDCIEGKRYAAMVEYAQRAVGVLFTNKYKSDSRLRSIAIVNGQAIGGGLEFAMSCNFILAHRSSLFQLPETKFSSFPGLGGFSYLSRKVGEVVARRIIDNNLTLSTSQAMELGIVDAAFDNEGELEKLLLELRARIRNSAYRDVIINEAIYPTLDELQSIAKLWVEDFFRIQSHDMYMARRLAAVQRHKSRNAQK